MINVCGGCGVQVSYYTAHGVWGGQITLAMWCLWADMCQHVHVALVLFRRSCGVCVAFMCVLFMFALVVCVVYVCVGCACAGFA